MIPFSQAAFSMAAATLAQHADLTLHHVNMHPAKTGFLRYAILMGARIHILDQQWMGEEPVSNLRIQHAKQLQAIAVRAEHIETLQDELPLLGAMAACVPGTSLLRGIQETHLMLLKHYLADVTVSMQQEQDILYITGSQHHRKIVSQKIFSLEKDYV